MMRAMLRTQDVLRLAKLRRLPLFDADLEYFVLGALGELFGADAPSPFSVEERDEALIVLGYTERDASTLAQAASERSLAEGAPAVLASLVEHAQLATRALPVTWQRGARYSYAVRACPVVRNHRGTHTAERPREEDAFMAACRAQNERDGLSSTDHAPTRWKTPVDRAAVYAEWLRQQVARHGGDTVIESASMTSFVLDRLTRRGSPEDGARSSTRKAERRTRPNAVLEGTLTVGDPTAFAALLTRGVGRHRAFGFGMLLLRPVR
jgi:CRISPR system Cascade subunit CasE